MGGTPVGRVLGLVVAVALLVGALDFLNTLRVKDQVAGAIEWDLAHAPESPRTILDDFSEFVAGTLRKFGVPVRASTITADYWVDARRGAPSENQTMTYPVTFRVEYDNTLLG